MPGGCGAAEPFPPVGALSGKGVASALRFSLRKLFAQVKSSVTKWKSFCKVNRSSTFTLIFARIVDPEPSLVADRALQSSCGEVPRCAFGCGEMKSKPFQAREHVQ